MAGSEPTQPHSTAAEHGAAGDCRLQLMLTLGSDVNWCQGCKSDEFVRGTTGVTALPSTVLRVALLMLCGACGLHRQAQLLLHLTLWPWSGNCCCACAVPAALLVADALLAAEPDLATGLRHLLAPAAAQPPVVLLANFLLPHLCLLPLVLRLPLPPVWPPPPLLLPSARSPSTRSLT